MIHLIISYRLDKKIFSIKLCQKDQLSVIIIQWCKVEIKNKDIQLQNVYNINPHDTDQLYAVFRV